MRDYLLKSDWIQAGICLKKYSQVHISEVHERSAESHWLSEL